MVVQKSKTASNSFSLMQLLGGQSNGKQSESFALMLQQLGIVSETAGRIKNGSDFINVSLLQAEESAVMPPLQEQQEGLKEVDNTLLKLLEAFPFDTLDADAERNMINPQLLQGHTGDDVKQLIVEAKAHLKLQIGDLAKRQGIALDIETLPKNLQSLAIIAEKIGIDVTKITLDTFQNKLPNIPAGDKGVPVLQPQQKSVEYSTQALVHFKRDYKETRTLTNATRDPIAKQEPLKTLLHIPSQSLKTLSDTAVSKTVGPETMQFTPANSAPSATKPLTVPLQPAALSNMAGVAPDETLESVRPAMERMTTLESSITVPKTPVLFGSEASRMAQTDDVTSESKIASVTSIESKPVALELKVKEAKQMVSHMATNLKEAVENYKPPFTRLTMQLNPAKLGEVDVTMIQRGNNVHINISSNNSAIAVLAQHSVELRNQLANNGLSHATMQFNTGGGEQQRQSQHQQNMAEAYEKYAALEGEESHEALSSLEIIIPQYV